ncbi:hypothetical protein [Pelomonas aquatica]|uniref:Uncharacterized protein n=1 Tax=Pelomonas aquatica TaxID=431058 RepID=A0A9X4R3U7_9BURK|nr:hypothetical protein [Pelomonas aquatica]MCY4755189.1 hypothetical protein [Pelomonas aquatica]MDG0862497.1 hypothetical protein [Pelomonas aquatica]
MLRTLKITNRKSQAAEDLAYWRSRPMAERMAAVETLRQQLLAPHESGDAEPRLQRVCRVAQRARR